MKKVKATFGKGPNAIAFEMDRERAKKVLELQLWIKEKREREKNGHIRSI